MSSSDAVVSAFTVDQVVKVSGLSERQIAYWDRTEFLNPQYAPIGEGRAAIRIYSFRDLVSLRTLSLLRVAHKVSLQHLRSVAARLVHYADAPFAQLKLAVWKREVYFDEPESGRTRSVVDGQFVLLPIIDVIRDVDRTVASLRIRNDAQIGHIEQRKNVSHNARVVAGTRIPVRAITHFLEDGYSIDAILEQYPTLTRQDVEAVIADAGMKSAA